MSSKDKRKLAAIMFADVVGYSRMMARNEERTLELLKDFENICSPIISNNEGKIIKKVGDELFCEFSSAKQAVDCSLNIQKAIQPYNDSRPKEFKLQVRIGIHVGDIVLRDGDVFGDGVNVASRIQPFSNPGGICISNAVKESISSHPNYNIISEGQQELKNILEQHTLYRVETGYEIVDKDRKIDKPKEEKTNKWIKRFLMFIGFIVIMNLLMWFVNWNLKNNILIDDETSNVVSEKKILLIGDIISTPYYIEGLKWFIPRITDDIHENMSFELEIISDSLKNYFYDELVTNIEVNNNIPNLSIMNKHALNKYYTSKGELTPEYFSKMLLGYNDLAIKQGNVNDPRSVFIEDTSMIFFTDIMEVVGSRLGATTGIYRIKGLFGDKKYLLYSSFQKFTIDNEITGTFNTEVYSYDEMKKYLYMNIINSLNNYESPNEATNIQMSITDIKGDQVILKFLKNSSILKEGTILSVQRHYTVTENDSLKALNSRLDDLYYIKDIIDSMPNSEAYKSFYDKRIDKDSMKEINDLLSHEHSLATVIEGESVLQLWSNLGIKLKVVDVFDSTASAIIYNKDRESEPTASYAKVRVGDRVVFMKTY